MNNREDNKTARQVVAVIISVFLVWLIYFGSYLPWKKSEAFILTLQSMGEMRSVDEVEQAFDIPFSIPAPIGQEELIRHFSSVILGTVQRFTPEQASGTTELVRYVTENFRPIIERQRGMSFDQNLFILASLNEVAFIQTQNPQFLADAAAYYSLGHELAPNRPQFLYGLFDLYRIQKNVPKTTEIANQILTLWPSDTRTKQLLAEFLAKEGATTTNKTTH